MQANSSIAPVKGTHTSGVCVLYAKGAIVAAGHGLSFEKESQCASALNEWIHLMTPKMPKSGFDKLSQKN